MFRTWASDILPQDNNESGDVLAYTLLTVVILPSSTPGQGPWLSWPWVPGGTYQVQYETSLMQPVNWTPLMTYQQTNVTQTVSLDSAEPVVFYRLRQL